MKKLLIALALMLTLTCNAQPFREQGYKGSVSYTNSLLFINGIEASHGYMFNASHYLGAGVGAYAKILDRDSALYASVYAEYTAYWLNRPSTPFSSVKIGCVIEMACQAIDPFIEPTIGWSWAVNNIGLDFGIGCRVVPMKAVPETIWKVLPATTFTLNF